MDRDNVRWAVIILIGLVGLFSYMAGFTDAFYLLGLAAAIWIVYEAWDQLSDFRRKRARDRSRHQTWSKSETDFSGDNTDV